MAQAQPKSQYEAQTTRDSEYGAGSNLVNYVKGIWEAFKSGRKPWEDIWEECWFNFLGQYQTGTVWKKESEGTGNRSKAFIKLTALKCNTAHSKIVDVMFAGGQFPFDLTPIKVLELGMTIDEAQKMVKASKEAMLDHFKDIELPEIMDTGILEMAILGTGVLKGPIIENRKKQSVEVRQIAGIPAGEFGNGTQPYEIKSYIESLAVVDHVPLWEYYVDVNAKTTADSIGEIHFQRMLPANFRKLALQGGYDREAVMEAARRASAVTNDSEDFTYIQLGDNYMGTQGEKDDRVSTLEFWGLVPVEYLQETGCELPDDVDDEDSIEALVVLGADGIILKVCVNPIGRRPFYVCPYKKRPHVIYGVGVAEAMRDSQKMVNSSARMIIDNKALSGNGMVAINLDRVNTKRTKNLKVYPGKTWYTKGNFKPRDVIDSVSFADITNGLRELMDMFIRFSDEETGLPKYTEGTQDTFLNKTATGMSMLMTQANINLKAVMRNIDDYWIEPMTEAFYEWFRDIQPEKGVASVPVKVKATGCDSMMAKEIKVENLFKFIQATSSPSDAIFTDRIKIIKKIGDYLETSEVIKTDDEIVQIMEELTRQAGTPKDVREMVDLDRLYPLLARSEQIQILEQLGIQPDPNFVPPVVGANTKPSPMVDGYRQTEMQI
jgi:hypothetical protein